MLELNGLGADAERAAARIIFCRRRIRLYGRSAAGDESKRNGGGAYCALRLERILRAVHSGVGGGWVARVYGGGTEIFVCD